MLANLRSLIARLQAFWRPASLDRDLDDELSSHLQFAIDENLQRGMSPQEAERNARISLGGPQQSKESHRDARSFPFLESLLQDLRFSLRLLFKNLSFSLSAIFTLALGIGATTAIFSVVYGVLLRPLPYPNPDRIVRIWELNANSNRMNFDDPSFDDVRSQNQTLLGMTEYRSGIETVSGAVEPTRLGISYVSEDFLNVMGVLPSFGRSFAPEEQRLGANAVALVSYSFWRQSLGSTRDLASVHVKVGSRLASVIGVMPPEFRFPENTDVWMPREITEKFPSRSAHNWQVLARVKKGVRPVQARSELSTIAARLKQQYGQETDTSALAIEPLRDAITGNVRPALFILLGASSFLLLIACANVVNLALAQATNRERELCARSVLGAHRLRLIRQFLTEAFLLSSIGGALGVLLAHWGVNALLAVAPSGMPRVEDVSIDRTVLLFSLGTVSLVSLALGIFTALRAAAMGKNGELSVQSRGQTDSPQKQRAGRLLSIGQLAAALVLLVGAGLLGKSLLRLLSVDLGFRTDNVLTMSFTLPDSEDRTQHSVFISELLSRLRALPGVQEVGGTTILPFVGPYFPDGSFAMMSPADISPRTQYLIDRSAKGGLEKDTALLTELSKFFDSLFSDPSRVGHADYTVASEGFFKTLAIPVLQGRLFDDRDTLDAPHVALVSQSLAAEKWPNQNPIGRTIEFGNMDGDLRLLTIVGVVGDVREHGIEVSPRPTIYVDYRQHPQVTFLFTVLLHTSAKPESSYAAVRNVMRTLNPEVPVQLGTLAQTYSNSFETRRFSLILVACFSLAALLLAAVGIYGVTSYSVARRIREFGIRMALGASAAQILAMILIQTAITSFIGVACGVAGSAALTRWIQSELFGVSPLDPAIILAVVLLLLLVSQIAGLIPGRRASRVDPAVALRHE
jgi:ABC-type antimicrobial peptide transport system permease subunit